jgi:hypothetical protein
MNAVLSTATRDSSPTRFGPYGDPLREASPSVKRQSGSRVWPWLVGCVAWFLVCCLISPSWADSFDESPPEWERLLWGGSILPAGRNQARPVPAPGPMNAPQQDPKPDAVEAESRDIDATTARPDPSMEEHSREEGQTGSRQPEDTEAEEGVTSEAGVGVAYPYLRREPVREIMLPRIPPLYLSPPLPGEGVWQAENMPVGSDGRPVMYRTSYRPSIEYPNAVVHMLLFDMSRLSMKLYLGSAEPGGSKQTAVVEQELKPSLVAITNALWKQKHSGDAGTVYQGEVVKSLALGVATVVVYQDDSVDILEWNDGIPSSLVRYARQLRHLIVKDGKVVENIVRAGQIADSEIGLGFLLAEEQNADPYSGWYGSSPWQSQVNYGPDWFIATRSAFGVRPDGNLVFAAGHHISTRDLARAMVLAGCERAMHGDANPHNVLGNIYYGDSRGTLVHKERLSPEQRTGTLDRYVDKSYTSDFFGFFLRDVKRSSL